MGARVTQRGRKTGWAERARKGRNADNLSLHKKVIF